MYKPLTGAELLRMGHVMRWSIVRTYRPQTVAEHTTLVMLLALMIVTEIKADVDKAELLMHGLMHDAPEVRLGDPPTPTKKALREITGGDPWQQLENAIMPPVTNDPRVRMIVKLADMIEAYQFLDVEGVGSHAEQVKRKMLSMIGIKLQEARERWSMYDWDRVQTLVDIHREDYE